jgi:group I intron endonuclease
MSHTIKLWEKDMEKRIKKCGIYKITSPSGKIYIGQSVDIDKRWRKYQWKQCRGQIKLYNSFVKYGVENHTFEILEECSIEELNDKEEFYIKHYNCFDSAIALNLKSGGNRSVFSGQWP